MGQRFDAFFFRTAAFVRRVFPTRCKLTCELGCIGKIMTPATTCNSRFSGGIPRLAGIFAGKTHKNSSHTPTSGSHNSLVQTPICTNFIPLESRHRELGQIRARTGTRFKKKRAGNKTHFFSRTAAFARRVFPTRCNLTREPRCVGKMTTLATTCNSRFASSIPHSTGIFTGKTHKNSSGTPTSGSHNSLVRTPIRANFIPLESRH